MQSFTKYELANVSHELYNLVEHYHTAAGRKKTLVERRFYERRAQQYESVADRLNAALENNDKRMQIKS